MVVFTGVAVDDDTTLVVVFITTDVALDVTKVVDSLVVELVAKGVVVIT